MFSRIFTHNFFTIDENEDGMQKAMEVSINFIPSVEKYKLNLHLK